MNHSPELIVELKRKTIKVRQEIIRMTSIAQSGHLGGSLSCVEVLAALFFHQMRHDPHNPSWEERDRFILSKGHAAPALYATLALSGYFPVEELPTFRSVESRLQGHPDSTKTPGVEISTGSLGQGFSAAVGMALGFKISGRKNHVYTLLGDGELNEGEVWETAMFVNHHQIKGITAIIDRNYGQNDGATEEIMSLEPLTAKWMAFGWDVYEVNGHSIKEILDVLDQSIQQRKKQVVIIARTVKGKGVSIVEGNHNYHAKTLPRELADKVIGELQERFDEFE
ncbi:transketolase [Candidatus Aerophobetes bacterium]|nr:transketolase [Candidatus Aerophobetes bacterium]